MSEIATRQRRAASEASSASIPTSGPTIGGAVTTLRSASLRSLLIELEDGTAETREIERQIAAAGLRQAAKHRCVPDAPEGSALARFHNFVFMRP